MRINLVLEVLSVRRFAGIQEEMCCKALRRYVILEGKSSA